MFGLRDPHHPYLEEVNDGIVRQFRRLKGEPGLALDVGCGRGQLGEAIQTLGWRVWGVERHPRACQTARTRLDRLIEADLMDFDLIAEQLGDTKVDALVFSDVLEHTPDPLAVLEKYLEFVRPGGKVLISVPNFVVWTNRLQLALGVVGYAETGVMDATHLRLFTFRVAQRMVREVGCQVDGTDCTPHLVRALLPLMKKTLGLNRTTTNPRALIDSPRYQWYLKYVYPLERGLASLWRSMLAFRIIVVGTKPIELPPPSWREEPSTQLQMASSVQQPN